MRKIEMAAIALFFVTLAAGPQPAYGQKGFEVVTGKDFDRAMPQQFYLEGNAIPTEKRNAALLMTPSGHRLLVGLIDTSGYTSQVQEKYMGMMINEGPLVVCGKQLGVGSFGMGMKMPSPQSRANADFFLYDQGGKKVCQCSVKKDTQIKHPVPLQIVLQGGMSAFLYLGRYKVELKP